MYTFEIKFVLFSLYFERITYLARCQSSLGSSGHQQQQQQAIYYREQSDHLTMTWNPAADEDESYCLVLVGSRNRFEHDLN